MNTALTFTDVIEPSFAAIREYRSRFKTALKKWQLPQHQQNAILLSTHEWLTNLVQHANNRLDHIHISASLGEEMIQIITKDDGAAFTTFQEYLNDATGPLLTDLSESGRGLYLIKTMVPEITYVPKEQNELNCMTFCFPRLAGNLTNKAAVAIVEDDRAICSLLTKFLEEDYVVKAFHNAQTFLNAVNQNPIDLVISDISMPDMDGLQLRHQLALNPKTDVIPFIFLTSSQDSTIEAKALELGIDDYLIKPVSKNRLINVVKRVLNRKNAQHKTMGALLNDRVTAVLRPNLPEQLGSYHCQVCARSATSGGGDFIVHFKHHQNEFIILGDVMGHGIDAKFFAHAYAGYIQGLINSLNNVHQVSTILTNLSELIRQDAYLESVLLTCIAIKLTPNGLATIASAGHPKPFIIDQSGVSEFDISGSLLGIEIKPTYDEKVIDLNHKRLLFYTDGLLDVGSTSALRKKHAEQLKSLLPTTNMKPLAGAAHEVIAFFDNSCHHKPKDDATIILLEHVA